MEHIPAFCPQGVVAKQFVARRAPYVGRNIISFRKNLLRPERVPENWTATEDVRLMLFLRVSLAGNGYSPLRIPSSTPSGMGGIA